ncbi:MAG TPA: helix-hairpin-helix domain-containing protein, partial [Ohtaekwangia sp.]|nr:helix-hairpin-helix domain-containing protein [Ohtaekwangia sp.]
KRDANVETENDTPVISSLQTTGMHRSLKELATRHAIGEQSWGMALQYQTGNLDIGLLHASVGYGHTISRKPTPYNQFAFGGRDNTNTSMYLNCTFRNITVFGEVARSWHGGWGTVMGALTSLSPKLDFALLLRRYDRNFYTISGNAFSESTTPQNESGAYWGWKYRFSRRWITSGYVDIFRFPWLRYRSYRPSSGHEWLLRAEYLPSRKARLFIQVREEQKERNTNQGDHKQYIPSTAQKYNVTISSDYGINQSIRLKSRVQFSRFSFQGNVTSGMAIIQGINVALNKFQLGGHLALFDTEDYDNRQYAYENDVWLAYSLPAYDGKGIRKCVVAGYKVNKLLSLWIRYAHTRYADRDEIGSAMETIEGNIRNDIKFQARLKF